MHVLIFRVRLLFGMKFWVYNQLKISKIQFSGAFNKKGSYISKISFVDSIMDSKLNPCHPLDRRRFEDSRLGKLLKNCLIAFYSHIDGISIQNLNYMAVMVSWKRCLNMVDRRTLLHRYFLSRWSNLYIQYFVACHMSASACYIH